jgi:hypothetical protein
MVPPEQGRVHQIINTEQEASVVTVFRYEEWCTTKGKKSVACIKLLFHLHDNDSKILNSSV